MASTVKNSCRTCLLLDVFFSSHLQSRSPNQGRVKIYIPGGSSHSLRQLIEPLWNMSTGQFDLNNHLSRFSSWIFQGSVKLAIKINFHPSCTQFSPPPISSLHLSLIHAHSLYPSSLNSLTCNIWVFACGFV